MTKPVRAQGIFLRIVEKYVTKVSMKHIAIVVCIAVNLIFLSGCTQHGDTKAQEIQKADVYAAKGLEHVEKAITLYKDLLKRSSDDAEKNMLNDKLGNMYFATGRFPEAIECFKSLATPHTHKKLAIAYFKNAQYTDALAHFEQLSGLTDSEYLYYYGQAAEKANLYDKAISLYRSIEQDAGPFYQAAQQRIAAVNLSEKALSSEEVAAILENAPDQKDYPDAGAVILSVDESLEIFENNTSEYAVHFLVKIFNERGKQKFSEIVIGYDSTYESVELEYARTIKPDGTVVYVGDKNIRDVSMYLNYPLYSNARARIISMPEVAEGVIVEYRAREIRRQLVNKKDFISNYSAQEDEPIRLARFSVTMPQDREFHHTVINKDYNSFGANLVPQQSVVGNKRVFTWQLNNIPEIIPEQDMPPASRINPIIMMSSFSTWEAIYTWWYSLYSDKITVDDAMRKKASELIVDKPSVLEKTKAIYNYCAQDIRYVAVEYGQAGYEPHSAVDIFKNKYGDCKDQAILLIAMLRSQGITAYPVLIGTYDAIDLQHDFPSIAFDHCIAVINIEDTWIFMDPTGETVSFNDLPAMDQNRDVFVVLDDGYKIMRTPLFSPEHNVSQKNMEITIRDDETIRVDRNIVTGGVFAQGQRYWLRFTKPPLIEEVLQATANAIAPGARLENYTIENVDDLDKGIVLKYKFEAPEFLTKAETVRLLPQLGSFDMSSVVKEERLYPIEYPIVKEEIVSIQITIPKQFSVHYIPENLTFDSEWFSFENTYSVKDQMISFYEKLTTKKHIIVQKEYDAYKELLETISRRVNQRIILHEKK